MINQNPNNKFETKYKEFENWLAKQSLPVEYAAKTIIGAVQGGTAGFVGNVLFSCSGLSVPTSVDPKIISWAGRYGPLVGSSLHHARNFAVAASFSEGITCVMKRLRGKEDIHTRMAAGFGYGVMLSLFTGMRGRPCVILVGGLALAHGGSFKIRELENEKRERVLMQERQQLMEQQLAQLTRQIANYPQFGNRTQTFDHPPETPV